MPANVSFEYARAEKKFIEAKTIEEKMAALQEMRSAMPSHKGAEKLRAEITKKIARLRGEMEKKAQKKSSGKGQEFHVKKDGCGQIAIIGFPNTGKSTLLKALTGVEVEIASFPFTTKVPVAGMMNYEGARVQLVEVPAIIEGSAGGKAHGTQIFSLIRNTDAVALMLNARTALEEFKKIEKELEKAGIFLNKKKPGIQVKQTGFKGITIAGKKFLKTKEEEFVNYLKNCGIHHASIVLSEFTDIRKLEEALDESLSYKISFAIINEAFGKANPGEASEIEKKMPVKKISGLEEKEIAEMKKALFDVLEKILIYTKKPGEKADTKEPIVLNKGATVEDVAQKLHKDFAQKLKFVKVWGSTKFAGQMVARNYKLKNKDVIEIYS